jgi:hypothetical protein
MALLKYTFSNHFLLRRQEREMRGPANSAETDRGGSERCACRGHDLSRSENGERPSFFAMRTLVHRSSRISSRKEPEKRERGSAFAFFGHLSRFACGTGVPSSLMSNKIIRQIPF